MGWDGKRREGKGRKEIKEFNANDNDERMGGRLCCCIKGILSFSR